MIHVNYVLYPCYLLLVTFILLRKQYVVKSMMIVIREKPAFSVLCNRIIIAKDKLYKNTHLLHDMIFGLFSFNTADIFH